jgi:hypothetical protein
MDGSVPSHPSRMMDGTSLDSFFFFFFFFAAIEQQQFP